MIRMPCRVLYTLLGEDDRHTAERQAAVDRMRAGKKLPAYLAIPPFMGR